ncbi:MAG: DUF1415 domain-containing protein [Gammaproteobacteria bacterium]|nr:DUF1415 domain-containing protein [Gammaproteobacteria bacterium]
MLTENQVVTQTRQWVQDIVIRHNLCPFAYKPFRNDVIRYHVCMAAQEDAIVEALIDELKQLRGADREKLETTLLVTPNYFHRFDDYNQFLNIADALIKQFNLEGTIQIASFHPDYQFSDLEADDVRNYTNRSLYPMFHLILEKSIEEARESYPDVDVIPENNMKLLAEMGLEEVQRQWAACKSS